MRETEKYREPDVRVESIQIGSDRLGSGRLESDRLKSGSESISQFENFGIPENFRIFENVKILQNIEELSNILKLYLSKKLKSVPNSWESQIYICVQDIFGKRNEDIFQLDPTFSASHMSLILSEI